MHISSIRLFQRTRQRNHDGVCYDWKTVQHTSHYHTVPSSDLPRMSSNVAPISSRLLLAARQTSPPQRAGKEGPWH